MCIARMGGEEVKSNGEEGGRPNSQEEKILVSVRLRPLNERELVRNDGSDWECISENTIMIKNSIVPTAYTFDRVFGFECPTKQVYEEGAKEVILSVVRGINSTIFAYGQTSSGKTYTMNGITDYAVADICGYIEVHKDREFVLKFSAMEIYNEAVRDLLSADGTPLRLLDDPEKGTVVEKLTEEVLRDQNHLQELLAICEAQRKIGETSLNETSSRSHQILRLTIESSARDYQGFRSSGTLTATVNFVDLAGSERASQTLSTGARLKEGSHINRSLLTLGTVIRKLSKGKDSHIPFRDSKLTRILQNSLGGNARTAIICTLSPARSHVEQSRNTLSFASCANEVTTNAKVNVVMSDKALVKQLKRELAKMEDELRNLTSKPVSRNSAELLKEKELLIEQMGKEIKELRKQRDLAESRIETMLGSAGENRDSRLDENFGSESTSEIRMDGLYMFNSNSHRRQPSQNSEDSFLLGCSTPKFVGPDPSQGWEEIAQENDEKHEDIFTEVRCIESDELRTDPKREADVREERGGNSALSAVRNESAVPSADNEEKELSLIAPDYSYEALKQKIQDMQRTINCLVNLYPPENSPCSSEACMSSLRSVKLTRSRSCKAVLTSKPSSVCLKEVEQNENTAFARSEKDSPASVQSFWWKSSRSYHGTNIGKLSRKDSESSTLSVTYETDDTIESDVEETIDKDSPARENGLKQNLSRLNHGLYVRKLYRNDSRASVLSSPLQTVQTKEIDVDNTHKDFSGGDNGLRRKLLKSKYGAKTGRLSRKHSRPSVLSAPVERHRSKESDSEDTLSVLNFAPEKEASPRKLRGSVVRTGSSTSTLQSPRQHNLSWLFEFERLQQEIIELWDACYVPLVHRTYFFLLFKGEPSDSVYFEVELRRLSFLKETFSVGSSVKKDSQIATRASSLKILNCEREMLSKQVHKKYARKERERLYQKWGIMLNTKQRSLQLARRLWTNTKDVEHFKESAVLVAKLIGFVEQGQVPKEIIGLSFSPQPAKRKQFVWGHTMSSLS